MSGQLLRFDEPDAPAVRLICFPHAGASARVYASWAKLFPAEIELRGVDLPGRDGRAGETVPERLETIAAMIATDIEMVMDLPYAFYGHSLGSMLAYAVARELNRRGAAPPLHLFVSGGRAPQVPLARQPMHSLPDQDLIAELVKLGGIPPELLREGAILAAQLPLIRADFRALETYQPFAHPVSPVTIPCGLSAFGGLEDHVARPALEAWAACASGGFRLAMLPGGHFFNKTHAGTLAKHMRATLFRLLDGRAAFAPATPMEAAHV